MDASWVLEPLRRLRLSSEAAPEPWRRAARSVRVLAWALAGVVAALLAVWLGWLGILFMAFGAAGDVLPMLGFAVLGLLGAAAAYLLLAWAPSSLYEALVSGAPRVRLPARLVGVAVSVLGVAGFPVAAWSMVQDLEGWVLVPLLAVCLALGVAGPWLVVAGVRLARLRALDTAHSA